MARIRLKGIPAIVVGLAFLGVTGQRLTSGRSTLDGEARQELELILQGEYASRYLPTINTNSPTPEQVEHLLQLDNISFRSLTTRGKMDDMIVRVEILVDGGPPPDGESVRYWQMQYSTITGWRVRRETHAFRYYSKLF